MCMCSFWPISYMLCFLYNGKFLKLFCLRLSTDPEVSMFFNKAKSFFYNNKHEWCCLYVLCYLWALWGELITELSVIQRQQELCCRISLGVDLLNKKLITLTVISQNIRLMHCTILKEETKKHALLNNSITRQKRSLRNGDENKSQSVSHKL